MMETLGVIAAIVLPLWNIPLIVRIEQRKSSKDVSIWWAIGVETCLLLMLPSGLHTTDPVYKAFTIANALLFSAVVVQVIRYRRGR